MSEWLPIDKNAEDGRWWVVTSGLFLPPYVARYDPLVGKWRFGEGDATFSPPPREYCPFGLHGAITRDPKLRIQV